MYNLHIAGKLVEASCAWRKKKKKKINQFVSFKQQTMNNYRNKLKIP